MKNLTLGEARDLLIKGFRLRRAGWGTDKVWVRRIDLGYDAEFSYQEHDYADGTLMPFMVLKTSANQLHPWAISQEDALAQDWEIAGPTYLFAPYTGPLATDRMYPMFALTRREVFEHRGTLDDHWRREAIHLLHGTRWERVADSLYRFVGGTAEEAEADLRNYGFETTEAFRAFVGSHQ